MNDTFERIKSSVNQGITKISIKTSTTIEKSKIKSHIESLNKDIDEEFEAIGRMAYKMWEDGTSDSSKIKERFEVIKQKYAEIEKLKKDLEFVDDRGEALIEKEKENH